MINSIKFTIDPALVPLLQWTAKLASITAVIGWCYFVLVMAMAQIGPEFGPSGRQLPDMVSERGPLMFGLLVCLSVLAMKVNKLVQQSTNVATSVA